MSYFLWDGDTSFTNQLLKNKFEKYIAFPLNLFIIFHTILWFKILIIREFRVWKPGGSIKSLGLDNVFDYVQ